MCSAVRLCFNEQTNLGGACCSARPIKHRSRGNSPKIVVFRTSVISFYTRCWFVRGIFWVFVQMIDLLWESNWYHCAVNYFFYHVDRHRSPLCNVTSCRGLWHCPCVVTWHVRLTFKCMRTWAANQIAKLYWPVDGLTVVYSVRLFVMPVNVLLTANARVCLINQ